MKAVGQSASTVQQCFVAFDVLLVDGQNLANRPQRERADILSGWVEGREGEGGEGRGGAGRGGEGREGDSAVILEEVCVARQVIHANHLLPSSLT